MPTDFYDAHQRHFNDADTLYTSSRWANADHLFGLSAECGLKALMQSFGMMLQPNGAPTRDDRKHMDNLLPRYEHYRSGHAAGAQYALSLTTEFDNWSVNQRYDHQSNFSQSVVDPHQQAALTIRKLIQQAKLDGLL
ncbi:MAG: SAM-dependent methyltransferase [Methyloprofundus sp.]|nr:SAM-dependent methyltransferase [Methyloprofundus sp.]